MHRVAVLAFDGVHSLDIAIPIQVFGTAHGLDKPAGALFGSRLYDVVVCGDPQITVTGVGGIGMFQLTPQHDLATALTADTIVVPGVPAEQEITPALVAVLRGAHQAGIRIAAVCSGTAALAEAGLLDGRRATCHWSTARAVAERFPLIDIDSDVLFVDDGDLLTSAGAAAALDLCVHMIRRDFGAAVAAETARHVVIAPERDGAQAQVITHHEPVAGSDSLEPTMRWMRDQLGDPITLQQIARHAALSTRTLNRRFRQQTGTTPLQWLVRQRVRHAQELLETTELSVEEVARHCGFGTATALRQHFARHVKSSPVAYRRAFQAT